MATTYLECVRHKNDRPAPLDDVLHMVEVHVVLQDVLGRVGDVVEAVVGEEQDVELQVGPLLFVLDVRQPALEKTFIFQS